MSTWASTYEANSRPEARLSALALALEISQFGHLLADPDVQRLAAGIGRTARPEDLGLRPPGRFLGVPCGIDLPHGAFSGRFVGQISAGSTALDVDTILMRNGDRVAGTYSFGAGFGRINGEVEGDTLVYDWIIGTDTGRGRIVLDGDKYRGTWGMGEGYLGAGEIGLTAP